MKVGTLVIVCSLLAFFFLSWIVGVIGIIVGVWLLSQAKAARPLEWTAENIPAAEQTRPAPGFKRCPKCRQTVPIEENRCVWCGADVIVQLPPSELAGHTDEGQLASSPQEKINGPV